MSTFRYRLGQSPQDEARRQQATALRVARSAKLESIKASAVLFTESMYAAEIPPVEILSAAGVPQLSGWPVIAPRCEDEIYIPGHGVLNTDEEFRFDYWPRVSLRTQRIPLDADELWRLTHGDQLFYNARTVEVRESIFLAPPGVPHPTIESLVERSRELLGGQR